MLGSAAAIYLLALAAPSLSDAEARRLVNYPAWAVRAGAVAAFHLEAVVDAAGKPQSCRIASFAGSERLAAEQCKALMRRRFRPATSADGNPSLGFFQTTFTMLLSGKTDDRSAVEQYRYEGEPTLQVSKVPKAIQRFPYIHLAVAVDADGAIQTCKGEPNELTKSMPEEVFDRSCETLKGAKFEGMPELLSGRSFVALLPVRLID